MKKGNKRGKLLAIFGLCIASILNKTNVDAALYASKGDQIPVAIIEYNSENNATVFPKSYQEKLNALKEAHPNWTFMAVYTNLDWFESIKHESYEINDAISLVPMSYAAEWKRDGKDYFKDGTWVTASKIAVAYALDPRNYLNEQDIFQFESLSCVEGVHTVEAVEKVLAGTELETKYTENEAGEKIVEFPTYTNTNNIVVKLEKTYAQVIYDAGLESGVSPIHIATRIIQETGGKLTNGSICGTNEGYIGYYNFFNIGAVPGNDGNSAVTNGLITAKNNGWDSPEKAIKAGALTLYNSYIKYGQDTVYFQKFDVSNSKGNASMLYACQYMTNILAPASESKLTYKAYSELGILDSNFVFYIPVYQNRTLEAANKPGTDLIDETKIENDNEEEEIKEPVKVTGISTSKSSYSIGVDKTVEVSLVITPEDAENKKYTATIENEEIVKIEGNKLTGLKEGETKITFTTEDGNFTTTITVSVTEAEPFEVDKEKLNITENNKIIGIMPETSLKNITDNIKILDGVKIECRNINGDLLENEARVGTSTQITISNEETVLAKYNVVVSGDVNGDGKISASDYVLIKNSIMGTSTLNEDQLLGADVNSDSNTNASDYVLIKNHIMGTSSLY